MQDKKELADLLEQATREEDRNKLDALIRRITEILNQGKPKDPEGSDEKSKAKGR